MANGRPGDWDTGPGLNPDGPYLNPPDQGNVAGVPQYYALHNFGGSGPSSGGLFQPEPGSLFAGAIRLAAHRDMRVASTALADTSLLPESRRTNNAYRHQYASGSTGTSSDHYGFANPPDHLFLQFFTMPIVQPYAISEPLSTAGKVNLNYQLAPFTYIERSTALRGVLKNTLLTGISAYDVAGSGVHHTAPGWNTDNAYKFAGAYYPGQNSATGATRFPYELRYDINRDATIAGIEEHYFNQGQIFMYPSQICDVFLVPQYLADGSGKPSRGLYNPSDSPVPAWPSTPPSAAYDSMVNWWNATSTSPDPRAAMSLTGDNLREEPYDRLYPRLTTQSNTYTVNFRVQVLQKRPNSKAAVWDEGQDQIVSEYRGSSLIERYIDPADPNLNNNWDSNTIGLNEPAGGTIQAGTSCDLSQLYKFRVITTKKFTP